MKKIFMFMLIALTSISVMAQKNIEKAIKEIENMKGVMTTYSERRTPKDHKLYRISLVLNFGGVGHSEKVHERLAKAFEEDRKDAVNASKTTLMYSYKFIDDKGNSTYTLNGCQLIKKWESSAQAESSDNEDIQRSLSITVVTQDLSKADIKSKKKLQRDKAKLERDQAKLEREMAEIEREMAEIDRQIQKIDRRIQHDLAKQ